MPETRKLWERRKREKKEKIYKILKKNKTKVFFSCFLNPERKTWYSRGMTTHMTMTSVPRFTVSCHVASVTWGGWY